MRQSMTSSDTTIFPHVLAVDDDPAMRELIADYLGENELRVSTAASGAAMMAVLADNAVDVVVLDLRLAGEDGMQLARNLREQSSVPIIMVTGKKDEADRVMGLELGADDYITKPFSPRELVARIKAHLRRSEGEAAPEATEISLGPFRLDQAARRVYQNGKEVELTSTEFKLLEFFITHPGHAFSREQLLRHVWGEQHFVTPRTVDVHVRRLREQIETKPDDPVFLATVRGFGYRFEAA
jgi:DNA-binding response OmpR family regulator